MRRLILLVFLLLLPSSSFAATATLTWDPNSESDLAGYKVYRATKGCAVTVASDFAAILTTGKVTTATDTLTVDGVYCYQLTAFDTSNNESGRSNKAEASLNVNPPQTPTNLRVIVTP